MEHLKLSFNKYLPVVLLYFFFNGFLLPIGLLYTTLLTPLFLIWLARFRSFRYLWLFPVFFVPFLIAHLARGVEPDSYIRSSVLLFTVFVFAVTVYQFLHECKSLRAIFRTLLLLNAGFVLFALLTYPITPLRDLFWYSNQITPGAYAVRLKLLTYEPSYYATLMVPFALYYYLKMTVLRLPEPGVTFFFVTIPFLLSLSFGGILGLALALILTLLAGYPYFFSRNVSLYLLVAGAALVAAVAVFFVAFPHNFIVIRFGNILSGHDTSFKGRTYDAFFLGWHIAGMKSHLFGCGPGQFRQLGLELFRQYYTLPNATPEQVAIPNSLGDTLAAFGLLGLGLRLFIEVYFFFRTKVWRNYYRLSLFLFIFIYQFTGSFLTNIAEYVIWVMAFQPVLFPEFDKQHFRRLRPARRLIKPLISGA